MMRSCFRACLGSVPSDGSSIALTRGVVGLLGQSLSDIYSMSPGILFLRTFHLFHDPHFFTEVILKLVIECACNLAQECSSSNPTRLKSGLMSLTASFSTARQVAILGATLLYAAGQNVGLFLYSTCYFSAILVRNKVYKLWCEENTVRCLGSN